VETSKYTCQDEVGSAKWLALQALQVAGVAVACEIIPQGNIAGAVKESGNAFVGVSGRSGGPGKEVGFTVTLSFSDRPTLTPAVVMTPAAGALAAQVGVSATAATFQATGGSAPYVYTMVGLPTGMAISSSTGVFNGTPAAGSQGTKIIEVTATDANSVAITNRYTVVIAAA
jgi:hypothetical protein